MYHVEVTFRYSGKPQESDVSQGIYQLLGAWVSNGQILDADCPVVFRKTDCRAVVACPEPSSLQSRHANKCIRNFLPELRSYGLLKPKMTLLGRGLESSIADKCSQPAWYLLMTNYLSIESPLWCGEHYLPVPLYRVPPTYKADPSYRDIRDILCWQREWKCCDRLQMACGSAERWATKQISDPSSALSITGRSICSRIEKLSGVPTYYYLYRGTGRSAATEQKRLCPSCGKKWLLDEPLHRLIDFKCDPCRLLSNIAWSVCG
ncbi:MAG: DUF2310 family Zn-ribbon-containing protein [Thermoguttaceae bacterium]